MPSRLVEVVAGVLDVPAEEVHPDTGPATSAWTSLQHLRIVAGVEDAYAVSITPREIRGIRSVADLRELLRSRDVEE